MDLTGNGLTLGLPYLSPFRLSPMARPDVLLLALNIGSNGLVYRLTQGGVTNIPAEWLYFKPHGPFLIRPRRDRYCQCHAGCRGGVYPGWPGGT